MPRKARVESPGAVYHLLALPAMAERARLNGRRGAHPYKKGKTKP